MQADSYSRDRDDEATYLLLFRHAHLVLSNLGQHPSRNDPTTKVSLVEAQREVQSNLKRLETLKPKINERYNRYLQRAQEQEARRQSKEHRSSQDGESHLLQYRTQQLQAHEHKDLAVKMAQKEFSRRIASQQAPPPGSVTSRDDLSSSLKALRARLEGDNQHVQQPEPRPSQGSRSSSGYRYPTVPTNHASAVDIFTPPPGQSYDPVSLPMVPPKLDEAAMHPPARPVKAHDELPNRSTTPQGDHVFAPSAFLENGNPLRPLFLAPTLRTTFLRIAHKNTVANLETCAFLAGTLMRNAFFVSKLIVPAQTATSDTCEMTNESDLFDYVDAQDLMILGWIHTHPTQTCFMSSRDLHTHAGYQMMLAESVAIVCAPNKGDTTYGGDWGAYRLTDPPGKKVILGCEKPGVFHPHEVDNVYTDALKPGHVVELKGMDFEVVDLRQ